MYDNLRILVDDIDNILDMMLLGGILSSTEGDIRKIEEASRKCEKYGLAYGGSILNKIREELNKKRHSFDFDLKEVVNNCAVLDQYIWTIKRKLDFEILKEKIKNKEGEE